MLHTFIKQICNLEMFVLNEDVNKAFSILNAVQR